jgi:uncharacterized protein YodC (DUF2158 family)
MASRDLLVGDLVRLKELGGPRMLVNGFEEAADAGPKDLVCCIWFDGDKLRSKSIFQENIVLSEEVDV